MRCCPSRRRAPGSHFAVSYYGANIFPEMVSIALTQSDTSPFVTGKFVMQVVEDGLTVAVELAQAGEQAGLAQRVADAILNALLRLNSEFAHYVPAARQRPQVTLYPPGHSEYFPVGVKHRYSR